MTRLLRGVVIAALCSLLAAAPVYAHAELEESDPADGETITTPYTLTATFSEEFDSDRSFIRVRDAAGSLVAEGGQDPDDPTVMTVELPQLPPGEYTVRWQTVTPDDNGVVLDTFIFNVAEAATPSPAATTQTTATTRPSVARTTTAPTFAPSPAPSPANGEQPTASGNDILLALALAAVVLLGLGLYLFTRRR